jgi:hypothetical protein
VTWSSLPALSSPPLLTVEPSPSPSPSPPTSVVCESPCVVTLDPPVLGALVLPMLAVVLLLAIVMALSLRR